MELLGFLIVFPLLVAALLLGLRDNGARKVVVGVSAVAIALASIALIAMYLPLGRVEFAFSSPIVTYLCTAVEIVLAIVVLCYAAKYKRMLPGIFAIIQLAMVVGFEFFAAPGLEVANGFYVDALTLMMVFIIGVIGSGICVYALGYMEDFQEHEPEGAKDRRPVFFALMFLFLSAMYLIVFSDNMTWLFAGWEVTTVCSFLLIGYTKTEEAINNAFRQIVMNMVGGIAFSAALFYAALAIGTISLKEFIVLGNAFPAAVALPAVLLGLAGITKAAQMPFHTWLLGAMVAPTPTSALLHSSTMVKAGVFLLLKLAPVFAVSLAPSIMVILVGGLTFALCSFMAISQTNAKRVLAYSTIANLGLIVACAGVGTPEAIWAGMFLMLFHAAAKSLLFLCVGTAEHHIGSRDIESMDLLFERMPKLARLMMMGIMVMFIAPFGMLVSKWGTLVSFVDSGQIALIILLAFGSAATFMFWAKWLGKLSGIAGGQQNVELSVHRSEWVSVVLMAVVAGACCILMPTISGALVEPYIVSVYGCEAQTISMDNLWLAAAISIFVLIVLFAGLGSCKGRKASVYLAGVSSDNEARVFRNSFSQPMAATARNWYMKDIFGEKQIKPAGEAVTGVIIIVCLALACASVFGLSL